VGIGRPESREPEDVSNYVLSDIPPDELDIFQHRTLHNIIALLEPLVNLKVQD
jgi:peptidyl-tRNA hydrolase